MAAAKCACARGDRAEVSPVSGSPSGRGAAMNWLFPLGKGGGASSSAAPLPALTSLQQQKQRQIESLRGAHAS